jgi:hypothetical protein
VSPNTPDDVDAGAMRRMPSLEIADHGFNGPMRRIIMM